MELISKFENPVYIEKLKALLDATKEWGKTIEGYDLECAEDTFMDTLGDLCMDYFHDHLEEARIVAFDYGEKLRWIHDLINEDYIDTMSYRLQNIDVEVSSWVFVSRVKTNIEAFNTMFGHITGELCDPEIRSFIEERKGDADIIWSQIPKNAPKSHWWWYA